MWKYVTSLVLLVLILGGLATYSVIQQNIRSSDGVYVLFVGDDLVSSGNMPRQLAAIANANGVNLTFRNLSTSGATLSDQRDRAFARMQRMQYDFVIFQEQGQRPLSDPDGFLSDVYFLSNVARETGAIPVLYSPAWVTLSSRPDIEAQDILTLRHAIVAYDSNAILVNAGDAWVFAYYREPQLDLYQDDMVHANYAGAFFTACVIAYTLLDIDITTIPQNISYTGGNPELLVALARDFVNIYDNALQRAIEMLQDEQIQLF